MLSNQNLLLNRATVRNFKCAPDAVIHSLAEMAAAWFAVTPCLNADNTKAVLGVLVRDALSWRLKFTPERSQRGHGADRVGKTCPRPDRGLRRQSVRAAKL